MASDGAMTDAERASFHEACPAAKEVTLRFTHYGTRISVGVTFSDGRQHGMLARHFDGHPETRSKFLQTCAGLMQKWFERVKA